MKSVKHTSPAAFIFVLACAQLAAILPLHGEEKTKIRLQDPGRRKLYYSLRKPIPADSSFTISDTLALSFPDLKITLLNGQLLPLLDSTQAFTGWLFEGEAQVEFRPRHELERAQLARFADDSVLVCTTSQIMLRFSHAIASYVEAGLPPPSLPKRRAQLSTETAALPEKVQKSLLERRGLNLATYLMRRRLVDSSENLVICAFHPDRDRHFFPPLYLYLYDPLASEQVVFLQYHAKGLGRPLVTACSYALSDYFNPGVAEGLGLTKYTGWLQLDNDGSLEADIGIEIPATNLHLASLHFALAPDLRVARVLSEDADTLDFVQEKDESGVTVFLPEYLWPTDTLRLLFHYQGDLLRRHDNGSFFLKDAVYWVPKLGYLQRAHYSIVYKCPPRLRVLAVGELVRDWREGEFRLSFYKTRVPAKAATFCMGNFKADTLGARIEIYTTAQRSRGERREVAGDVANSLYFFESLLMKYPLPVLRVVEAPTVHSQGFPGLVTLSWIGFASRLEGPIAALRSHEVAHQWFGNLMGWSSYHDQWLSEAVAEYLGALYVEWKTRDPARFDQILTAWRDDVLERGHIGASMGMQRFGLGKLKLVNTEGMKAGPVWMGTRLGQKEALDYYLQTYEKGAYVLHMLRCLMTDIETGSDDRFWRLLAAALERHQGTEPASADFQRLAEEHYGSSLDWFFQQWLYRTEVPTYKWSFALEAAAPDLQLGMPVAKAGVDAKADAHVLRVRAQQENVPADFRMPVPVMVEFADGTRLTERMLVTGEGGELELPLRSAQVKRVIFNAGSAVLCRVKE